MEIICDQCDKKYVIDENKLPEHGSVVIKCPNCSGKIRVNRDPQPTVADDNETAASIMESDEPGAAMESGTGGAEYVDNTVSADSSSEGEQDNTHFAMEYFPEGTKTALIFCPDFDARNEIEKHLQQSGYEYRHVTNVQEMSDRFRYHQYDVIVLHQSGPEPSPPLADVIRYIIEMQGAVRRKIIVIHIKIGGSQYNEMQAFLNSTDMLISPTELSELSKIIKRLEERKDQTYRVFFDCLEKVADRKV